MRRRGSSKAEVEEPNEQFKPNNERFQEGRWTDVEKLKYQVFVDVHYKKFSRNSKRKWKIYKALSGYVKTRSPEQCRSHHRKLLLRFQTLQKIVENGRRKYEDSNYDGERQKYCDLWLKRNAVERNYTKKSALSLIQPENNSRQPKVQQHSQQIPRIAMRENQPVENAQNEQVNLERREPTYFISYAPVNYYGTPYYPGFMPQYVNYWPW